MSTTITSKYLILEGTQWKHLEVLVVYKEDPKVILMDWTQHRDILLTTKTMVINILIKTD
jgi:hypothetical protein